MDRIQPQRIRWLVEQTARRHLPGAADPLCEQLLIRQGHYCGHSYQLGPVRAIWFRDEDQLKFYDQQGQLLEVLQPSQLVARGGPEKTAA